MRKNIFSVTLALFAIVSLVACISVSQPLLKRPSWLHGRSIETQMMLRDLNKRPSWLVGRSIEDINDEDLLKENGLKSDDFQIQKRPSWLVGRSFRNPTDKYKDQFKHTDEIKKPRWLDGIRKIPYEERTKNIQS